MKISETSLAVALAAVLLGGTVAASAQQQPLHQKNPSASLTANTNAIPSKLVSLQPAAKEKKEIQRAGNMSSRPWTEIVGWQPGVSQFPDAENHGPGLTLLSVSFGPQHRTQPAISRRSPPP